MLSIYHPLISHSRERKLIWTRKVSVASIIFITTRYVAILEGVALAVQMMYARYYSSGSVRPCISLLETYVLIQIAV